MKRFALVVAAFASIAGSVGSIGALAAVRSSGQTYVYQLTVHSNTKADFSALPASFRGQAEAQLAKANKTPLVFVVTLNADRANPDGSAHVNVGYTYNLDPPSPIMAQFHRFDGQFTPDGRFIVNYDPNMQVRANATPSPEEVHNTNAGQFDRYFADFNTFAGGNAKRGHFKVGDTWRVTSRDRYGNPRTFDFSVTGVNPGSSGLIAATTMTGDFASQAGSDSVRASGHYDVTRGLVLDLHKEETSQSTAPNGSSSSSDTSYDFALQQ
jgi:hypothetical protein